jgi:fibronectin type 3 domain-containing protein
VVLVLSIVTLSGYSLIKPPPPAEAACQPTGTTYGTDTMSLSVPSAATYRLWVRLQAPVITSNSMMVEVDGGTCYNVGDSSSMPLNSWNWVDYQNGSSSQVMQATFAAGKHSLKLIGTTPGVSVDKVLLLADTTCVPTGLGTNCTPVIVPLPSTPTSLTATAQSPTQVILSWSASTDSSSAVSGYNVFRGGTKLNTAPVTSTTYSDTTAVAGSNYSYTVQALDSATPPNTSAQSNAASVTTPMPPPPTPTKLVATAPAINQVQLSWAASLGATGYYVLRSSSASGPYTTLVQLGTLTFQDGSVGAGATYYYEIEAYNGTLSSGVSAPTLPVKITTPNNVNLTPPNAPTNLIATAISSSQINLSWTPGATAAPIVDYLVYRNGSPVATIAGSATSYGDSRLSPNTVYRYYLVAYNSPSSHSGNSLSVTATTQSGLNPNLAYIYGVVSDSKTHIALPGVVITGGSSTSTNALGQYVITNGAGRTITYRYSLRHYKTSRVKARYSAGIHTLNEALSKRRNNN